jgi:hypothetical protein
VPAVVPAARVDCAGTMLRQTAVGSSSTCEVAVHTSQVLRGLDLPARETRYKRSLRVGLVTELLLERGSGRSGVRLAPGVDRVRAHAADGGAVGVGPMVTAWTTPGYVAGVALEA